MLDGSLKDIGGGGEYLRFYDDELPVNTNLNEVHFRRCLFENIGMKGLHVSGGSIKQSCLRNCYCPHAVFEQVDFTGTEFIDCNLREAQFINCFLDYATFKGCEVDYRQILAKNTAKWNNTQWRMIHSLRLNAQNDGDNENQIWLLLDELRATRAYERSKFMDTNSEYNKRHYSQDDRVRAFFKWLSHQIQFHAWGYGLKPMVLFRNGAFVLVVAAATNWLSMTAFRTPGDLSPRALTLGESLYVSVVTFTTLGYGDFSPAQVFGRFVQSTEAVFGAIFLGLFAATAFRRIGR